MMGICERCEHFTESCLCNLGINQSLVGNGCMYFSEAISSITVEPSEPELLDIIKIINKIKLYTKETIVIRRDTHETLANAINPNRAKLLLFLEDIFVQDIFKDTNSDFFYNYLQTLQPFMFYRACKSDDKNSEYNIYGEMLYIFEYPCGTQSIQIKVCLHKDNIVMISFHQGASGIMSLANRYHSTIQKWKIEGDYLVALSSEVRLYVDHICLTLPTEYYDSVSKCHCITVDSFFSEYRKELSAIVNSIFEGFASQLVLNTKSKVSVYSAISIAELKYDRSLLSDKGRMHAIASLKVLFNETTSNKLTEELKDVISVVSGDQLIQWLKEYDIPNAERIMNSLELKEDKSHE